MRITYWVAPERRVVLLTVFAKTRHREHRQVDRAKLARKVCAERHQAAVAEFSREWPEVMDARTAIERRHAAWRVDPVEALDPEARRQRAEAAAAMALAKAVYDARSAAQLTEGELAARAGLVEDDIVCIEESGTVPTPELLDRLARALDGDLTLTWSGNGVTAGFVPHAA